LTLGADDFSLLMAARRGDRRALGDVCNRFKLPILALALRATADFDQAAARVEPALEALCRGLASGSVAPHEWARRAADWVALPSVVGDDHERSVSGLEGLESIPRVVRRRVLRQVIPQLPLPELLALLLMYLDQMPVAGMVGLVADSPADVEQRLLAAHDLLQKALEERLAP
jgi:hypothetical protein